MKMTMKGAKIVTPMLKAAAGKQGSMMSSKTATSSANAGKAKAPKKGY